MKTVLELWKSVLNEIIIITSAIEDMASSLCLFVCLSASSNFAEKKTTERICMKFLGKAGNGRMNK